MILALQGGSEGQLAEAGPTGFKHSGARVRRAPSLAGRVLVVARHLCQPSPLVVQSERLNSLRRGDGRLPAAGAARKRSIAVMLPSVCPVVGRSAIDGAALSLTLEPPATLPTLTLSADGW